LDLSQIHESLRQPGLFVAGTIGKLTKDDSFIKGFREFGPVIAKAILAKTDQSR
jgi:hypothetical protein